jgi:hypothetical protein
VTRVSGDDARDGHVWNGFDDALQVWVVEGVVQPCGHPPAMSSHTACCAARVLLANGSKRSRALSRETTNDRASRSARSHGMRRYAFPRSPESPSLTRRFPC